MPPHHARKKAKRTATRLEVELKSAQFPPHVISYLETLERELVEIVDAFDEAFRSLPIDKDYDREEGSSA